MKRFKVTFLLYLKYNVQCSEHFNTQYSPVIQKKFTVYMVFQPVERLELFLVAHAISNWSPLKEH